MHPELHYQLMQARVADLHAQAQRDALARAVRRTRHTRRQPSAHPVPRLPAIRRRILAALGVGSA
jgi:hypothetical protein